MVGFEVTPLIPSSSISRAMIPSSRSWRLMLSIQIDWPRASISRRWLLIYLAPFVVSLQSLVTRDGRIFPCRAYMPGHDQGAAQPTVLSAVVIAAQPLDLEPGGGVEGDRRALSVHTSSEILWAPVALACCWAAASRARPPPWPRASGRIAIPNVRTPGTLSSTAMCPTWRPSSSSRIQRPAGSPRSMISRKRCGALLDVDRRLRRRGRPPRPRPRWCGPRRSRRLHRPGGRSRSRNVSR